VLAEPVLTGSVPVVVASWPTTIVAEAASRRGSFVAMRRMMVVDVQVSKWSIDQITRVDR
jgi:hypothetical protein